jgi:phage-related protein
VSTGKDLVLAGGVLQTPPMPIDARRETGFLLRLLQEGQSIGMPKSRPMPSIGHGCHELRVQAENTIWRTLYFIDMDAIVVLEVFAKKTTRTPPAVIDVCKQRLRSYHAARREEQA